MTLYVPEKPAGAVEPVVEIEYPESDGQPMGETEYHVVATLYLLSALRNFLNILHKRDDIYVIADMFLYYEEGNPGANKVPDVMVIKGVESRKRRIFQTWKEGAVPSVIVEVTSRSTWKEDTIGKSSLYGHLGVTEYFLFDPLHEYMEEQLIGFRLIDGEYVPLEAGEDGSLYSEELDVILRPDGDLLRVINPQNGRVIPGMDEVYEYAEQAAQQVEKAIQQAEQEAQRAAVAEAEADRLQEELDRLRRSKDK